MNSVRMLISIAVNQNWSLFQFDVKNAFLHGDLEEEVYMAIPPCFRMMYAKGKVCKLKKTLYGLKQSLLAWFERFKSAMLKSGYKQAQADHTLFVKIQSSQVIVLIVYVDDIIVTGNDAAEVAPLKDGLAKEFEIKDLGSL